MTIGTVTASRVIGQVATELTRLPKDDLPLVLEFVNYLKRQHLATPTPKLSASEMRAEARRRASLLQDVSRTEIVARFEEVVEEIRQQAIVRGTAIEGDWQGD